MTPAIRVAVLVSLAATPVAAQSAPELSWGAAVTTNYISKGVTQSDDKPAIQGYAEIGWGFAYGGIWASSVDLDGDYAEYDIFAGVRHTVGNLSLDLNYTRYVYNKSGDCCGEFILFAGYSLDVVEVGLEFDYDPVYETRWGEAIVAIPFLEYYEAGGNVGTDFGSHGYDEDKVAWDFGVSRTLGDVASIDLRYYDSNLDDPKGALTLAVDF